MINKFQTFMTTYRHRHKETGDSTRTINQFKTQDVDTEQGMSRDMYIDLPDNNLPHISQTNYINIYSFCQFVKLYEKVSFLGLHNLS